MSAVVRASAVAVAIAAFAPGPTVPLERTRGPLRHDVYVWQRAWTAPVTDAVRERGAAFSRVVALGAEIEWRKSGPAVAWTNPDLDAARSAEAPGIALRIGPWSGSFDDDTPATQTVTATAAALLDAARTAGVAPSELHIDFDCATSKLAGFRRWIDAIRRAAAPTPVTFTALPSWLGSDDFPALAHAADGYVLQVHSLARPASPDGIAPLCDADRAHRWAERAARLGVPFRVALPTYGYAVAFTQDGQFLGIAAESDDRAWPAGTRTVDVAADPTAIAGLVRTWTEDRPAALVGLIWYRLPVPGDQRNWTIEALRAVRRGEVPVADVTTALASPSPGLSEIRVRNTGAVDGAMPARVDVRWTGARLVAADALAGFAWDAAGDTGLRVRPLGAARIAPGTDRVVAWLRLDGAAEVTVDAVR